jgi:hypothetical protein
MANQAIYFGHELTRKNTKGFAAQMAVCDSPEPQITRINTDFIPATKVIPKMK